MREAETLLTPPTQFATRDRPATIHIFQTFHFATLPLSNLYQLCNASLNTTQSIGRTGIMDDLLRSNPAAVLLWIADTTAVPIPTNAALDPGVRALARAVTVLGLCFDRWGVVWKERPPVSRLCQHAAG